MPWLVLYDGLIKYIKSCLKDLVLKMKLKNMTAGLALVIIIITGVLVCAPGGNAGGAQHSSGVYQYKDLNMSPF